MKFKEATKNMTTGQKIAYVWYYYKWFILIGIFLVIFFGYMGYSIHKEQNKNYIANIELINCETYTVDNGGYFDTFLEEYDVNDENMMLSVDSTMEINLDNSTEQSSSNFQTLAAMFISGEVDLFVSDDGLFDKELEKNAFEDLRIVIPEEELNEWDEQGLVYWAESPDTGEMTPYGLYLADRKICTEENIYDPSIVPILGVGSQWQSSAEDTLALIEYMMQ